MTAKSNPTLVNFFVFNGTLGHREGEEDKKIMFYYPKTTDVDTKIKNVGLCEAVIKFTETFSDESCETLHTLKSRQLFFEPEKHYWMVMTVSIPQSEKVKDGQTCLEYHEDDVQDHVYNAVLKHAYRMFQLFNGTFKYIIDKSQVDGLKQRLDHFFIRYLMTLKLNQCDVLDVFNGIHFLPLDKNTYLRVQCFINLLEATIANIKYTSFLYNDQLVWSGLAVEDMQIIYKYLTTSLLPNYLEQELQAGHSLSSKPGPSAVGPHGHYGKFVTGPRDVNDLSNMGKIPRVFVNTEQENEECYLLVYKALSATVCLFVTAQSQLQYDLFTKIDNFLGPQLTSLASDVSEQYVKNLPQSTASDPQYRYIYFNHMNLAQKTTIHVDRKPTAQVPPDMIRIVNDINAHLNKSERGGETIVKTMSDNWVVGKKSDQREFYVIINTKNANLIEINEEVKKLCAAHFNSIFFLE